jgi:DnaJ-domain-containing protein 1
MTILGKIVATAVGVGVVAAFGACVRKVMQLNQKLTERDEMLKKMEGDSLKREAEVLIDTTYNDKLIGNLRRHVSEARTRIRQIQSDEEKNIGKIKGYYAVLIKNREDKIEALGRKVDEMESVNSQLSIDIDEQDEELQEIMVINGELESRVGQMELANAQLSQRVQELEDRALQLPDFYKLLNLDRYDHPSEFKMAYRKAIRDGHPDKLKLELEHPSEKDIERAWQRTNAINRAYTVLSHPELRILYHKWLDMAELRVGEAELHDLLS